MKIQKPIEIDVNHQLCISKLHYDFSKLHQIKIQKKNSYLDNNIVKKLTRKCDNPKKIKLETKKSISKLRPAP